MDQIYPDAGLLETLGLIVTTAGWDFHLYTNNLTPTLSNVLGDFTEAAWAGYVVQTVLPGAFTIQAVVSHLGNFIAPPVSFSNTSGSNKSTYGYFITWHTSGHLVACARFDNAPIVIPTGQSTQVIPILADFSGLSS